MNIGNQKVHCIGNNYYIETENKKLYPIQVLLFYGPRFVQYLFVFQHPPSLYPTAIARSLES
jgi:hypothetical protein